MKNVQQVREFLPSAVLIFACFIFLSIAVYSYNQLDLAKNDIEGTSYTYINKDGYQYVYSLDRISYMAKKKGLSNREYINRFNMQITNPSYHYQKYLISLWGSILGFFIGICFLTNNYISIKK